MKKALWDTSLDSNNADTLLANAKLSAAKIVCIRTTSAALPAMINKCKAEGIDVYGWRWPAVIPNNYHAPHYFALDEAKYVVETLIPAGLAGYIVDPESDGTGQVNDWNDASHAALARQFCQNIRAAAPAAFHFGVTSGCEYPTNHRDIPWAEFVAGADALYPQAYWRMVDKNGQPAPIHGGTPQSAYSKGIASWKTIAKGKPIIAIGGELAVVDSREISAFGTTITGMQTVAHFFSDSVGIPSAIHAAIAAL